MNGFLILDKPQGVSSANCVYKLRSMLGIKRIGHCGTLDPLATGLLPICIGEATKFWN
jgi:tRNA pseudouridine55 synthase